MCALAVIAALTCGAGSVSAADIELRAVRHSRNVNVSDSERLAAKLVALVESCSVNSTAYTVAGDA
jgi:hypothetical protein